MKAGYGKTVRPVCAADGGKLFIGRLLRPDSCEADEQGRATGCGVGGAKGGGRGECASAKHGPGTVPGDRVTGAGAHTEFRENITTRRYIPEVGAVCPNWARTDLCGGREVTRVPTAKVFGEEDAFDRCCRKSLFASLNTNSPSRGCGDLTNVWGEAS